GAGPAAEAGGGCHETILKDERGVGVDLKGSCFWPTVVRIDEGQKIAWTNRDDTAHTVTGAVNSWGNYDELNQGDSVSYSFANSGVFPYFCLLHPSMVGAVVVGEGTAASAGAANDGVKAVSAEVPGGAAGDEPAQIVEEDSSGRVGTVPIAIGVGVLAAMGGFAGALVLRRKQTLGE
ncbi:MAG: cupredoxin domain-containing protein, partial [bacterium]